MWKTASLTSRSQNWDSCWILKVLKLAKLEEVIMGIKRSEWVDDAGEKVSSRRSMAYSQATNLDLLSHCFLSSKAIVLPHLDPPISNKLHCQTPLNSFVVLCASLKTFIFLSLSISNLSAPSSVCSVGASGISSKAASDQRHSSSLQPHSQSHSP